MNQISSSILHHLRLSGGFLSGEDISASLGITRSAVWKHIGALRREGYRIDAVTGQGYRLSSLSGRPVQEEVSPWLTTRFFGRALYYHELLESTNLSARVLAGTGAPEGSVVVADAQSGGRGRVMRSWVSPGGVNLYFSLILRPRVQGIRVPQLTLLAAAAVHQALSSCAPEIATRIKWPNDIMAGEKKLCGVLCEMQSEPDMTHFVIIGIGINVNIGELPDELKNIATSLFLESGRLFSRPELLASVLNHFESLYEAWLLHDDLGFLLPYLHEYSLVYRQQVIIRQVTGEMIGTVSGISRGGELMLDLDDARTVLISSGDCLLCRQSP
ncbi:MAG: biotin--[acetyl-CoA-carboxylase] ligase [Chlorobiaceae bacterium]|nr:biotin--[acetyl-CoA-carboxylase] ligase [Chlorobiaceae bacterium]